MALQAFFSSRGGDYLIAVSGILACIAAAGLLVAEGRHRQPVWPVRLGFALGAVSVLWGAGRLLGLAG